MKKNSIVLSLMLLLLGACSTTSEVLQPRVDMPGAYRETSASQSTLTMEWWQAFGSAELANLIALSLQESPDLAMAMERVRQAEAQVRVAGASLFPQLELAGGSSRRGSRESGESSERSDSTGASLEASYEVDLWGLNAADVRGADALLRATEYDHEAIRLTLLAGVANAYFEVLSLRDRLAVARQNVSIAERVLNIVEIRFRNGVVSSLDVARQRTTVLNQRANIPALERQERQTLAALAILIGRPPQAFDVQAMDLNQLAAPVVAPGLPPELLTRRPDLAAAEAQLISANANLAAARAALLPSLRVSASGGGGSAEFLSLASPHTATYAIAASVLQTIFDGGRLRAEVDVASSRERELVESYRKAILSALADVENALAATSRTAEEEDLQRQARDQASRALRLSEVRYREGADDLLSVLDAQRSLFLAQEQLALVQLSRLQASVSLFKALGGGWQAPTAYSGGPAIPKS
ncbi:MAG TPA: efflux transporter outer membrane subunit [Burkholderiales bacterium]|nr:efflux transporter outer membrane subunit [Burkholderiales bacterium]